MSNTTGTTTGTGTVFSSGTHEFTPVFSRIHVTRSLVLCVMFCRSLFVLLSFVFWPLCCLFFFDLRILVTLLVSSISSWRSIVLLDVFVWLCVLPTLFYTTYVLSYGMLFSKIAIHPLFVNC